MIELQVNGNYIKTLRYELGLGKYKIGKAHDATIILMDSYVSNYHAELTVSENGLLLRDLNSTNGTWLDNKKIQGPTILYNESQFRIGNCTLKVTIKTHNKRKALSSNRKRLKDVFKTQNTDGKPAIEQQEYDLHSFKQRAHELLLESMDEYKHSMLHTMGVEELKQEAILSLHTALKQNGLVLCDDYDQQVIIKEIVDEAIGLGPLESLLNDSTVSEIMVNGHETIYVERQGLISRVSSIFSNAHALMNVIERMVTPLGRRIDESSPMVDARLEDGSRINAIIPPLALNGPVLTIRKFKNTHYKIQDLVEIGTLSYEMSVFLTACVKYKKNIIVSGGTGSGKTTLLNVLSNAIPSGERIITIEDAAELKLNHNHVVSLECRPNNTEGTGLVTMHDLVRNALRMRPDRIIIGECRGGEALDMMQAMNTGHEGSLTTCHANSVRDVLSRLEIMMLMSGYDIPVRVIREQIASSVDIIIQLVRSNNGKRSICAITQVGGMEGDTILLQDIFLLKNPGTQRSYFTGCGTVPSFFDSWDLDDESIKRDIFNITNV